LFVPCSFYSRKLIGAECNYEIYDKEILVIVRSLEEFDSELRGLDRFEVYSDHKNLEYFMTVRKLTERQMRWSLTLSRYNFRIVHVSGTNNGRADALSRRDQDLPKGADDSRIQERFVQLIKPEWLGRSELLGGGLVLRKKKREESSMPIIGAISTRVGSGTVPDSVSTLPESLADWEEAVSKDYKYRLALESVEVRKQRFPPELRLKVSISEYSVSESGKL